MSLAGDYQITRAITNWLSSIEFDPVERYESVVHKTDINVKVAIQFLTKDLKVADKIEQDYFEQHRPAIVEIAEGKI